MWRRLKGRARQRAAPHCGARPKPKSPVSLHQNASWCCESASVFRQYEALSTAGGGMLPCLQAGHARLHDAFRGPLVPLYSPQGRLHTMKCWGVPAVDVPYAETRPGCWRVGDSAARRPHVKMRFAVHPHNPLTTSHMQQAGERRSDS